MARVEISQNKGPEVIKSWDGATSATASDNYGPVVNVRNYTLHSYHVINHTGGSSVTFKIIGSNYTDPSSGTASSNFTTHWTTISTHTITPGSSLAYSDIWNFKYACIHFTGSTAKVEVYEKHNA